MAINWQSRKIPLSDLKPYSALTFSEKLNRVYENKPTASPGLDYLKKLSLIPNNETVFERNGISCRYPYDWFVNGERPYPPAIIIDEYGEPAYWMYSKEKLRRLKSNQHIEAHP